MKNISKILTSVLFIAAILFGFFVGERVFKFKLPQGQIIVDQSFIDSLIAVPKLIKKDSIIWKDTTIYKDRLIPVPIPTPKPDVFVYIDSIVNDSTHIIITDSIRGELLDRQIEFVRAIIYHYTRVPYPVIVEKQVFVHPPPPFIMYGDVSFGGNSDAFLFGGEVGYITGKDLKLGFQTFTDFGDQFYMFKLGKSFRFK